MNLQRRSLFGISIVTWVVLGLGVLSGAAMAAEHIPWPGVHQKAPAAIPPQGTYGVPSPQTPAIPAIPEVPRFEPTAQPPATMPNQSPELPQPAPVAPLPTKQVDAASQGKVAQAPQGGQEIRFLDSKKTAVRQDEVQEAQGMGIGLKLFLIMLVLLGAAFVIHTINRKNTPDAPHSQDNTLELASTIQLGGRWQVSLIRVPGRMLVVGATESGLNLLAELDPESDEDEETWLEELKEVSFDTPSAPPQAEFGTYQRPAVQSPPEQEEFPEILQKAVGAEDCDPSNDAYLDHLMQRLAKARPAVIRSSAPADERASLRKRVRAYQRGPTRL